MSQLLERHTLLFLLIILLLASFLRVYQLNDLPSGFHGDKASFLLNAQALQLNGRDEDNKPMPLYLTSIIDPKPALYSYLQIPFIATLGSTYAAARLPAAILGVISLFLVYLLISELINKKIALLSALLLAISPWHIVLSRGSQEVILSFTFGIAAILYFVKIIQAKKIVPVNVALLFLFSLLSMYAYHSAKIFLPAFFGVVLIQHILQKKVQRLSVVIIIACIGIALAITTITAGFTRFHAVGPFSDPSVQLLLDEKIRVATGHAPSMMIRLFNNKVLDYSTGILKNYGEYFSTNFLFITGGQPTRYVVPFSGLLYVFEILFLLVGIVYAFTNQKLRSVFYFLLCWLLIAPIPGALTRQEIPSIIRVFPMVVPFIVFIALGIYAICTRPWRHQYRPIAPVFLCLLYVFGFGYFWFHYTVQQPNYHPWSRNYGDAKLPSVVASITDKYDRIYISTNQYAYFALAGVISIPEIQHSYPRRLQKESTYGKITFIDTDCNAFPTQENFLFIVKGSCPGYSEKEGYQKIGSVPFKDNAPEYNLYEYHKPENSTDLMKTVGNLK